MDVFDRQLSNDSAKMKYCNIHLENIYTLIGHEGGSIPWKQVHKLLDGKAKHQQLCQPCLYVR